LTLRPTESAEHLKSPIDITRLAHRLVGDKLCVLQAVEVPAQREHADGGAHGGSSQNLQLVHQWR
jgi:hypothetical protein